MDDILLRMLASSSTDCCHPRSESENAKLIEIPVGLMYGALPPRLAQ